MKIGVPKEIKIHEYRVGLVPAGVRELVDAGHEVLVQTGAGAGIGFEDSHYEAAGANIAARAADIFATADLVVKVKEPQLSECKLLRPGQTLFTYLHLAADREQAQALVASGATAIAYETVTAHGRILAAADADERSRRPHVGAGGRQLPAKSQWRFRRIAGRRARRGARQGRHTGRRSLGHSCGRNGRGSARRCHGGGSLREATARAFVDVWRAS